MSLIVQDENGTYVTIQPLSFEDLIKGTTEVMQARFSRGEEINTPALAKKCIQVFIGNEESEIFGCLFLGTDNRIISMEKMFFGTVNGAQIYIREIIKKFLACNAQNLVTFHQHPSGRCQPSSADLSIDKQIREALGLIGGNVIDNIIVSPEDTYSFAENGLI